MTTWRKSSHSGGSATSDCVELARFPQTIGVRDSKNPHGPSFTIPDASFRELVTAIKRGDHNLP